MLIINADCALICILLKHYRFSYKNKIPYFYEIIQKQKNE